MATVKLVFRANPAEKLPGTLFFRIIHKRKVRLIHTGCRLFPDEWDQSREQIRTDGEGERNVYLSEMRAGIREKENRIKHIIQELERDGEEFGVSDIIEKYQSPDTVTGFISFCRRQVEICRKRGRTSAAEHYLSSLNRLVGFWGEGELPFEKFDADLMSRYQLFLKESKLCPNTISYYMRKLRALYNDAVEEGLTIDRAPFRQVYTGVAKTRKRAITLEAVKALKELDLQGRPLDAFARDVFLFSFYTRGMAPVDIAYARKDALRNGFLCYRRRKTSQTLRIKWTDVMEDIVSRHGEKDSPYLLPLIKTAEKDERRQYLSAAHLINRHLRILGKEVGLEEPLTLYVARHAWASIALSHNVPIGVISQGMGHDSEKTTRIYIATLDTSALDRASQEIIGLVND